MPQLSIFTPCGMLELSGRDPVPQGFYQGLIDGYGGDRGAGATSAPFDFTPEAVSGIPNHAEASVYARAMALARAQNATTRAGNQFNPQTAWDLILLQAEDWSVIPDPLDTIASLAAKITATQLLAKGARMSAMVAGLRGILGGNFIAYRPLATSEATAYPTWPSATARQKANPTLPQPTTKYLVLVDPVGVTGTPISVQYQNLDTAGGEVDLAVGDVVMVQPENTLLSEKVPVEAITPPITWAAGTAYTFGQWVYPPVSTGYYYKVVVAGTAGAVAPTFPTIIGANVIDGDAELECFGQGLAPRYFTATFAFGHDVGANVTTMSWPYIWSTQDFVLIVVTATAAVDAETRRQVNDFMASATRGVGQWAIVQPTAGSSLGGTLGPFTLSASPLGAVSLGVLSYVPSP